MNPTDEDLLNLIHQLLYSLGLTAEHTGFFHSSYAILLVYRDPERLRAATKLLYPETADHYHTTWSSVERNIRYVIGILWRDHPNRLSRMAGYTILRKPTPRKFISLSAARVERLFQAHQATESPGR